MNMVHTSNIMHRDIKPENILVDQYCHVRICDFGFARPVTQQNEIIKGDKPSIHKTLLNERPNRLK